MGIHSQFFRYAMVGLILNVTLYLAYLNRDLMHTIIIHQLPFNIGDEAPEYSGAWRECERRSA